jgi:hypothetical protein
MAMQGQTSGIDLLFSSKKNWIFTHDKLNVMEELVANRNLFLSKNIMKFVQYAQHQAAKYGLKGSRCHVAEITRNFLNGYLIDEKHITIKDSIKLIDILNDLKEFVDQNKSYENQNYFDLNLVFDSEKDNIIIPHESYLYICGKKFLLSGQISLVLNSLNAYIQGYGARAEAAKNNNGVDFKAISHAFRSAYQVKHIIEDGGFAYPLPESEFIIDVKYGKISYLNISELLENLIDDTKRKLLDSNLPEHGNKEKVEDLILSFYKKHHGLTK